MRTNLLHRMLDEEIDLCRSTSAVSRPGVEIWRDGESVLVAFAVRERRWQFALDCADFDAEPPSVDMVDLETHERLPIEQWLPGVPHSLHPVTGRPFVCIQGTAEYHSHPSHTNDPWDRYRSIYRLPQTIGRLLDKAGVPR